MRVWIAIWVGSTQITRSIAGWLNGGVVLRLFVLGLAVGFAKGLPFTTALGWLAALTWLGLAIFLGLREAAEEEAAKEKAAKGKKGGKKGKGKKGEKAPAEPPFIALLRAEIGDEKGVHLRDLYPAMRKHLKGLADAPDEVLRQVLTDHGIITRRSIRARGVAGRTGVPRSALPPLPSANPSPKTLSTPLSKDGDAGQSASPESAGEPQESNGEGPVMEKDPDHPTRWLARR